ncbi:pyridoxamine 5'-phosphate oxidase family protein [Nonomuraea dietziae]|uniref:pyridoxamine 5'-phosphate oxidase family protein n=1 Tax=Nonomuraea dietziae TaxID=65515 RepID=UPI00361B83E1
MRETAEDLKQLQALLDTSLSRSTSHLRSIINTERTLTAEQLTQVLTGMCTLALSTVTAKGEPRISGVDGHFLHGKWHFGTARGAAKARHLAARPAASVAHMRGEDLGVFTHGTVEILNPGRRAGPGLVKPARLLQGLLRRRLLRLGQRRGLLPAASALDDRLRPRFREAHCGIPVLISR